jgi:Ni,Fe-hydrogenase III large subunit
VRCRAALSVASSVAFGVTEGATPTSTVFFPLGPYHPALPEPVGLTLRLRGERIAGVEPPATGYCHRGIVELAQGKPLDDALGVVERACSRAHESHRLAFCQAVEDASGVAVPEPARLTRTLFAEIERILARLWTLAVVARAANADAPFAQALDLRENLTTTLAKVTGERVYWAVAVPGGVRGDLDLEPLGAALDALDAETPGLRAQVGPSGPLGRATKGIGVISAARAEALGLTGLAARGSRTVEDLRATRPYAGYADSDVALPEPPGNPGGDVAARLVCTVDDIAASLSIAQACLDKLTNGEGASAPTTPKTPKLAAGREGRTIVEGPHGPVEAVVALGGANTVARLRLVTPGAAVLAALPETLEGGLVAQAPVIVASLDLCAECLDL